MQINTYNNKCLEKNINILLYRYQCPHYKHKALTPYGYYSPLESRSHHRSSSCLIQQCSHGGHTAQHQMLESLDVLPNIITQQQESNYMPTVKCTHIKLNVCDCLSENPRTVVCTCRYFEKCHFENSIQKISLALVLDSFSEHNNT